jgi:peroxiredoxin
MRIKVKSIFLLLFIISTPIYSRAQTVYEHQFIVKVGDLMPDFEVALTNGTIFKLSEQKGKVVMLQFTASWCGVCRKEMPYIEKDIWKKLKDQDFVLVGIDYKEEPTKVDAFAKQMKISYPLAYDISGDVFHSIAEKGAGVTRNVIINREGNIIYLSRLFKFDEFSEMKDVIFNEVNHIKN